ncbi:hypothetical protein [Paraburkholderia dilworthii]|uniref:Uncharacterized protein n=1 Tax=Paraburkholderia dilworthii TaxID=948106 RepID=A0ABW9CYV1_9BURK
MKLRPLHGARERRRIAAWVLWSKARATLTANWHEACVKAGGEKHSISLGLFGFFLSSPT